MRLGIASLLLSLASVGTFASGVDSDGDGVPDNEDCRPDDGTVWSAPGEPVTDLALTRDGATAVLSWSRPGDLGGVSGSDRYDVLAALDPAGFGYPSGFCPTLNTPDLVAGDDRWLDPADTVFYLARVENSCGVGPLESVPPPVSPRVSSYVEVSSTGDSGPGTLREAIDTAADGTAICFDVTGTILLTSGTLATSSEIAIAGPGQDRLTVDGNGVPTVLSFGIAGTLSGVTVTGGQTGLAFGDDVVISTTTISGNSFAGAYSGGTGEIRNSTIRDNPFHGVYASGYAVRITKSTITGSDHGVYTTYYGSAIIRSSTIANNGAGIHDGSGEATFLFNNTFADNEIGLDGGSSFGRGNILANELDCNGAVIAPVGEVPNLYSDLSCAEWPHDLEGVDPLLGPLADHGGPTRTFSLLPGSPAIDRGSCELPADWEAFYPDPYFDQRGMSRVDDPDVPNAFDGCDLGAYEAP